MNKTTLQHECQRRFELQEEYLGLDKPVNQIDPLVSVCVITYQHAAFIRECLDSILMQETTFPYEVIIGEDASTDGTREICIEYAECHPDRVRLFLRDRSLSHFHDGESSVRFNGIWTRQSARGKYIALCEGDDYWTDAKKLQKQADILDRDMSCAGCFHETVQSPDSGAHKRIYGQDAPDIMTAGDTFSTLSPFHTSSFVFRRECHTTPEWFFGVVSRDMALFSIVAACGTLRKTAGVMSVYRKHAGGITNTKSVRDCFHEKRVELMQLLNAHHDYKYAAKAAGVIEYHEECMRRERSLTGRITARVTCWLKTLFQSHI